MYPYDISETWIKSSKESLDIPKEEWEILNEVVRDKFMPQGLLLELKKSGLGKR